jgi:nitroreductase
VELREVLRTSGAVRDFTDEPVDDATLASILDDARFAPSGGNRQGWRVVVLRDPALRRQVADEIAPVWNEYVAQVRLGETAFSTVRPTAADLASARGHHRANPLLDDIERVPVVLMVGVDLGALAVMDKDADRISIVGGASVYPFCHNILLAARDRGLGGVLTTFAARVEPELKPLLRLPEGHAIAAMLFLGHPKKVPTRLTRRSVESFTTVDRFDGPPFV